MRQVSTSVAHTASDALNAKLSALSIGHQPVQPRGELYAQLLGRINSTVIEGAAGKKRNPFRQQTPLVNAGYAARTAAVSSVLGNFVSAHNDDGCDRYNHINIVLLGGGLEGLGIWASALSRSPSNVHLYEIDCEEICNTKARALVKAAVISDVQCRESDDDPIVAAGITNFQKLITSTKEADLSGDGARYMLLAADLRNIQSVGMALERANFNKQQPTIVLSELVLAYLGRSYADELLRYVSSHLCTNQDSVFLAYEPLGTALSSKGYPSVVQDYVEEYCNLFRQKLNSGKSDNKADDTSEDVCDILGDGCLDVLSRFSLCGFEGPMGCCSAGIAASVAYGGKMASKMMFDEHIELALHLNCYGTACAFSWGTSVHFAQTVCPWLKQSATCTCHCHPSNIVECKVLNNDLPITISPIKSEHQERVRELIKVSYSDLFDEYPSVRKLVKGVLKSDLSGKEVGPSMIKGTSAIDERYSVAGGGFWVVTSGKGTDRNVIGCIGIRPCPSKKFPGDKVYEIQRFAVDDTYRSQGVGRALLLFVERYILKSTNSESGDSRIIATTPAVLASANHFYKGAGFDLLEEKSVGNMVMNTYAKRLVHLK